LLTLVLHTIISIVNNKFPQMRDVLQIKKQINRPEKGGSFRREGKKEGVWGRNFCLPVLLSSFLAPPAPEPRAAHFSPSFLMRAVAGRTARMHQRFAKFSWRLASMFLLEISSNFFIQAAPNQPNITNFIKDLVLTFFIKLVRMKP